MKTIEIYNRGQIEQLHPSYDDQYVYISVYTPGDKPAHLNVDQNCADVLRLCFFDTDLNTEACFDEQMALKVKTFLEKNSSVDHFIVHCDAGYSRSPAIGAAIANFFGQSDAEFFKRYRPNMLVYRRLLETFYLTE